MRTSGLRGGPFKKKEEKRKETVPMTIIKEEKKR